MPMYPTPSRQSVSINLDGKVHNGTYWVAGKIITVTNGKMANSTQTGKVEPESLAKQMLLDLVKAGNT